MTKDYLLHGIAVIYDTHGQIASGMLESKFAQPLVHALFYGVHRRSCYICHKIKNKFMQM
jgi:hypothetical protein